MVLYVSEAEMIERLTDSLKKSASRAKEFITAETKKKPVIFVDFISGLKTAAGSAHQLAHAQMNPNWLKIRDLLERVIEVGQCLPTFSSDLNPVWKKISLSLLSLKDQCFKLSIAKSMPRYEALLELDQRLKNMPNLKDSPIE